MRQQDDVLALRPWGRDGLASRHLKRASKESWIVRSPRIDEIGSAHVIRFAGVLAEKGAGLTAMIPG